jgi:hypothetical protein
MREIKVLKMITKNLDATVSFVMDPHYSSLSRFGQVCSNMFFLD